MNASLSFLLLSTAGTFAGCLLTLFDVPWWITGAFVLMVLQLALSGTAALFMINVGLTGLFFFCTVYRPWPKLWYGSINPTLQPRLWAISLLGIWLATTALIIGLGILGQEYILGGKKWGERCRRFLISWLSGWFIGRLLAIALTT
ncbi:MAG: hypothetical protein AAFX01_11065 [Cyanobacteria bacterium J06638_28]